MQMYVRQAFTGYERDNESDLDFAQGGKTQGGKTGVRKPVSGLRFCDICEV